MQNTDRQLGVFFRHDTGNADFRRADEPDVDILAGQGLEHLGGHPGVIFHTDADDRNLGDILIAQDLFGPDLLGHFLFDGHGFLEIRFRHRKRQVGLPPGTHVLNDHVDDDPGLRNGGKHLGRHPGLVRDFFQCDPGLVFVARHTGYQQFFHAGVFIDHHCTLLITE